MEISIVCWTLTGWAYCSVVLLPVFAIHRLCNQHVKTTKVMLQTHRIGTSHVLFRPTSAMFVATSPALVQLFILLFVFFYGRSRKTSRHVTWCKAISTAHGHPLGFLFLYTYIKMIFEVVFKSMLLCMYRLRWF